MLVNIFSYQASSSVQGIVSTQDRVGRLGASPNWSATPWASSQGIVRSLELQGVR